MSQEPWTFLLAVEKPALIPVVDDAEASWAEAVRQEFRAAEADPASLLVTPLVLQIVAEKR